MCVYEKVLIFEKERQFYSIGLAPLISVDGSLRESSWSFPLYDDVFEGLLQCANVSLFPLVLGF